MKITNDAHRDQLVAEMEARMLLAKLTGRIWYPSPADVQAIQSYDVRRSIEKRLGW